MEAKEQIIIPDIIGKTITEAETILKENGLEMQLSNEEEHIKDIFEKIAKNMQDIIEKQRSQYLDDGLEKIDRNLNMFIMQLGYNMLQN